MFFWLIFLISYVLSNTYILRRLNYVSMILDFFKTLSTLIVKFFLDFLANWLLVNKESKRIGRPIIWEWYFIISTSHGFIIGIIRAFTRLVIFFIVSMMSVFRIEATIFPPSLQRFDQSYISFMSYIYTLHSHDHPAWVVAADCWRQVCDSSGRNQLNNDKSIRAKLRWNLAYTLLIDPSLI